MKQTAQAQYGISLLAYASSRLKPEVFSHPIWVRFGKKEKSVSLKIVDDLFSTAKHLQTIDPSATCQILLVCAFYQNYAGQRAIALETAHQAMDLAKQTSLAKETIWAIWGICAICFQLGDYRRTADRLMDLRSTLSTQNEWMLASFIDVLKDDLLQLESNIEIHSQPDNQQPFNDSVTHTLDWLQRWGYSVFPSEPEKRKTYSQPSGRGNLLSRLVHPKFSFRGWRERWNSLILVFRGELKLHLYQASGDNETQIPYEEAHLTEFHAPSPSTKSTFTAKPIPEISPSLGNQNVDIYRPSEKETKATSVAVQMLGVFSIIIQDVTVKLPASRGLSLLKYLLFHHKQYSPREVLMDVFWPEAEPETARNNLNVAIYSFRRSLRKVTNIPVIVHENGTYGLAPRLQVWLDVEEFERCVQAGKRLESRNQGTAAVVEYETAISLYQGDFLEENPYEEWTVVERERLRIVYLDMLDRLCQIYFTQERYAACITICQLLLTQDRCREDAHCLLMRCYSRQGQRHLALRQYHICVEALRGELEVDPAPETTLLYDHIRQRGSV